MAERDGFLAAIDALEMALIGAVLADPPTALPLVEHIRAEDFYHGAASLPAAILEEVRISAARGEVSLHAIAARFAADSAYVADCYEKSPPATAAGELGAQLAASAVQRRLYQLCSHPGLSPDTLRGAMTAGQGRLEGLSEAEQGLRATPFTWRDPATLRPRDWLYGRHLIRRYLSCTVAPGGVGKTAMIVSEALAMVTGRSLLGERVGRPLRVWLFNGEDPREELERRVLAACRHFGLSGEAVEGRLFLDSGRDCPLILARQDRGGLMLARPVSRRLIAEIRRREVDVMVIDPFAASHAVGENDNTAINAVAAEWGRIAEAADCAIELVHHTRKGGPGQIEITAEDARGASALIAAARSARQLNAMTKAQAEQWSIDQRRLYYRVDNGKANLSAPAQNAQWRRLVSVDLENGPVGRSDEVGVAEAWAPPSVFQGVQPADTLAVQRKVAAGTWRASPRCENWVGHAVAEVLRMDMGKTSDKARIRAMIGEWLRTGALVIEERPDSFRVTRPFVAVGAWLTL